MLSILLPVALSLSAPQTPQESITRVLPLQHLCGRAEGRPLPQWGTLLQQRDGCDLTAANGEPIDLDSDDILGLLYPAVSDAVDADRLWLHVTEAGSLLATGNAADIAVLETALTDAERVVNRILTVEVAAWDASDRNAPAPILDAQQFARFVNDRQPLWRAIATTRPGRGTTLGQMHWTRYVRGINVEVAEKATVSNPVTDLFGQGGTAVVRAFSLIGCDDLAVHAQFAVGRQRGNVRVVQTGLAGSADLDLPRLESYFVNCSGRVAAGGALAVTMRGLEATGGDLVVTVRVQAAPARELSDTTSALLPIGALSTAASTARANSATLVPADRERSQGFEELPAFCRLSDDLLVQMVEGAIAQGEREADEVGIRGGYLYVHADAAGIARAKALLQDLQDRLVRNLTLHSQATLHASPSADEPHPLLYALTLPVLLGREATAARMLETNVISDVFSEIAVDASSLVPGTRPLQSGTWLHARAEPVAYGLHLDLVLQNAVAPPPTLRSVMPSGGSLMPTETEIIHRTHDGAVQPGQTVEHGDGPTVNIDGRPYRSRMTTTVDQ
ncbi:MAG TPA: hypothetical protein ENI87_03255 [bacterium]|nr:hypothetical protein [bacterium]